MRVALVSVLIILNNTHSISTFTCLKLYLSLQTLFSLAINILSLILRQVFYLTIKYLLSCDLTPPPPHWDCPFMPSKFPSIVPRLLNFNMRVKNYLQYNRIINSIYKKLFYLDFQSIRSSTIRTIRRANFIFFILSNFILY